MINLVYWLIGFCIGFIIGAVLVITTLVKDDYEAKIKKKSIKDIRKIKWR